MELELNKVGLVQRQSGDRIVQIGLTTQQSELLQEFLIKLSQYSPLIQMPEAYDLKLKNK
jgi:hypothetical protein